MIQKRSESMQQLLDATNEARGTMMEAAKAIAVDEQYGTLSGDGDGWDRQLYETMLNASDIRMQAGFLAIGVAHFIRQLVRKLDQWRDELDDSLVCDTDITLAHKEGVMTAIRSMDHLIGERDPMNLYEFYLEALNTIDDGAA